MSNDHRISIRLDAALYAAVAKAATRARRKLSDYCRQVLADATPGTRKGGGK